MKTQSGRMVSRFSRAENQSNIGNFKYFHFFSSLVCYVYPKGTLIIERKKF